MTRRLWVTMGALLACAVACANGETTDIGEGLEGGDDGPDETSTNEGGAEDTGQTILDTGSHDTSSSDLGSASDVPSSTDAAEETEMETGTTGDAGGCSLTSMTACASAAACCPMNGTTECVCQAGTATQGQACSSTVACAPGYVCVTKQGATSSSCSAWCAEPAGTCPSASTCTQLSPPTVIGGVTYGACL